MDAAHKRVLRQNFAAFVNYLELEPVLGYLFERKTITRDQYLYLSYENELGMRGRVLDFVNVIVRQGPNAFNDFMDALNNSGQVHLLQLICPDRAASRGTEQVNGPTVVSAPADQGSAQDEDGLIDAQVTPTPSHMVGRYLSDNNVYKMTNPCRGKVILINNEIFTGKSMVSEETIPPRTGSTKDSMNVSSLFWSLHFDVRTHNNLTAQAMRDLIKNETKDDVHQGLGMFVLVILSHGERGGVYGEDGKLLLISEIKGLLSARHFPHMAGKPKLILLQACQGDPDEGWVEIDGLIQTDAVPSSAAQARPEFSDMLTSYPTSEDQSGLIQNEALPPSTAQATPEFSDMLIVYPTSEAQVDLAARRYTWSFREGHVNFWDEVLGSWFIRAVVDVFMKKAFADHVADMLTEVRTQLYEKSSAAGYPQRTFEENHLMRKLYLLPGWTESP